MEKEMAAHSQYSCLGNSMDRGASVHRVTKSRTQLHDWARTRALLTIVTKMYGTLPGSVHHPHTGALLVFSVPLPCLYACCWSKQCLLASYSALCSLSFPDLWFCTFLYCWEVLGYCYLTCFFCCIVSHLLLIQFSSVAQSCLTLCDPMDCSTPGFPVHHQLPEFTQTHVHCVGDAIQPPHPLSTPSPALNLSQHQGLFQWVSSSYQVGKVLEFQLQHQSFQWTPRTDLL